MRYTIHFLLLVLASVLAGCNQADQPLLEKGTVRVKFSTAYANAPEAPAGDPETIDQINAYLCADGVVKKVFTLDALSDLEHT